VVTRLNPDPSGLRSRARDNSRAGSTSGAAFPRGCKCELFTRDSARNAGAGSRFFFRALHLSRERESLCCCYTTGTDASPETSKGIRRIVVIDCTPATHGCNDTYTGWDRVSRVSLLPFPFFLYLYAHAYKEYPAKRSGVNDLGPRGGDAHRKEGHRRKSGWILRTWLHLLRAIMHALGVFRVYARHQIAIE